MKEKLLIFIITYKASYRLNNVYKKIDLKKLKKYNVKILISDDLSGDDTEIIAKKIVKKNKKKVFFKLNKYNLHYGGNIKSCINYASKNKFKYAAMIHGDDQYSPIYIPAMLNKIKKDNSTCVCGSKMYNIRKALKAKMPLYKLIGNIVLTKIFNFVFKTKFSDCHTGLWLYNLTKLNKNINFKKISNGYNFDNQLWIELVKKKLSISEIPIIATYGDERSSVHLFYAVKFLFETIYRKYFN